MKFPIVRWAAKPRMRPITAEEARMPTATPADGRDHEQRRGDADEDDRAEDRLAEDPVARGRPRRELAPREPAVDQLREDEREDDHDRRDDQPDPELVGHRRLAWGAVSLEGSEWKSTTAPGSNLRATPGKLAAFLGLVGVVSALNYLGNYAGQLEQGEHRHGAVPLLDRGRRGRRLRDHPHDRRAGSRRAGLPAVGGDPQPAARPPGAAELAPRARPRGRDAPRRRARDLDHRLVPARRPRAGRRAEALHARPRGGVRGELGRDRRRRAVRRGDDLPRARLQPLLRAVRALGRDLRDRDRVRDEPRARRGAPGARALRLRARVAALAGRQRLPGDARPLRVQQLRAGERASGTSRLAARDG